MQPSFQIIANGRDITESLKDRLLQLSVTDEAGLMSDKVEIALDDRDFKLAFPPMGAKIEVYMGWLGDMVRMGAFVVNGVSVRGPPDTIQITAHAINFRGPAAVRKEKSWHQTTLGALVQTIAADHGYEPRIDPELASIAVSHEDQMESDLQFLSRLALENNAVFKPADGAFVFMRRAPTTSQSGASLPALSLDRSDLDDWSAELVAHGEITKVTASYQDRRGAKRKSAAAGGAGGRTLHISTTFPSEAAAKRAASARLSAINAGAKEMSVNVAIGDPRLRAERRVSISGMRPGVGSDWSITSAVHTIGSNGYSTRLKLERT